MMDVELTGPLPAVSYDGRHRLISVLGRLHTEPVGVCVMELTREGLSPHQLGALLWQEFREPVTERFAAAGLPLPGQLTGDGLEADPAAWPFLSRRRAVLAAAPFISVVVCTRDRPQRLQTWLPCLCRQEYPWFEVVVVDNAPTSAFRRETLARIGGFDVALGPGTPARAGEDLLALSMALLAGYNIVYEPAALMRHDHRRNLGDLLHQMEGYGTGLTAYYAALLRHKSSVLPELIRLAPTGLGYLGGPVFLRTSTRVALLEELKRRQRRSMLLGPGAYLRGVSRQARVAAIAARQSRAAI